MTVASQGHFKRLLEMIHVLLFPHLQKISRNDGKNDYKWANDITYIGIKDDQRKLRITKDNQ